MPASELWTSTFQGAILTTLSAICDYHLYNWTFGRRESWNWLALRGFYLRKLPRVVFCIVASNPFRYGWHLWLEKTLPTRPRELQYVAREQDVWSKPFVIINESLGDESIAQARLRRRTISWFNVFAKWMIDLTIGNLLRCTIAVILERISYFTAPSELFSSIGLVRRQSLIKFEMTLLTLARL